MEQHNTTNPREFVTDAQRIHHGVTEALLEDRPIDHATARAIASQLHGGQASPLQALASSGALVEGLATELDAWRQDSQTGVEFEPWLDALDEYLGSRSEAPEAVDGWANLWPGDPPAEADNEADTEIAACQELFERISAAGIRSLGAVTTVETIDQEDEVDDFPWTDAAEWRAGEAATADVTRPHFTVPELDALFATQTSEAVGTVAELGWYGLLPHEDSSGGLILITDEYGSRHVLECQDNEALERHWSLIQHKYETYHEERGAYEQATILVSDAPSGFNPRIWVGCLADYNNGRLHGVWMDATTDPTELEAAARFMLRGSHVDGAEEWAIFDTDGFGSYAVYEYSRLSTVSRIAQGVAEHGEAFSKWVEHVDDQDGDLLTDERFRDHYQGEFDSAEAFVEYYLSETEGLDFMRFAPEHLQAYVKFDVEMYARDWESEGLLVEELENGKVAVFLTR